MQASVSPCILSVIRTSSITIIAALAATGTAVDAHPRGGAHSLGDPDYGVCRGTDPSCYHDWGNFHPDVDGYQVLLFTRTGGPRHANLGPALGPGLDPPLTAANVVQNGMRALGAAHGFTVHYTEDLAQLATPGQLFRYNAVIFYSTSRHALDDAAQTALRQYLRGGGGFVGIHNAFGTEYNWPWYEGLLGGANFYDHGPEQPAVVNIVNTRDAATRNLPASWTFQDEWYNLVPFPSQVRFLAVVDERTMQRGTTGSMGHPGHGGFHPVAWCQYYDGGRAFLTTLGHDARDFASDDSFPGAAQFQALIVGGIESAMGKQPFCL